MRICCKFKDVPRGIPKSVLLGVTVALIHVAGHRPSSCEIRVLQVSYGKKWPIPPGTSLMGLYKNNGAVSCVGTYFLLIWLLYTIGLTQAVTSLRY